LDVFCLKQTRKEGNLKRDLVVVCNALEVLAKYFATHPKLIFDSLVESGIASKNDFRDEVFEELDERERTWNKKSGILEQVLKSKVEKKGESNEGIS
jgi:hypothetical protein